MRKRREAESSAGSLNIRKETRERVNSLTGHGHRHLREFFLFGRHPSRLHFENQNNGRRPPKNPVRSPAAESMMIEDRLIFGSTFGFWLFAPVPRSSPPLSERIRGGSKGFLVRVILVGLSIDTSKSEDEQGRAAQSNQPAWG